MNKKDILKEIRAFLVLEAEETIYVNKHNKLMNLIIKIDKILDNGNT